MNVSIIIPTYNEKENIVILTNKLTEIFKNSGHNLKIIVIERDPITFDYRDYHVHSMPPASSGGITIAGLLNQLGNINLSEISYHSAQHIHFVSEAER